jgi:hypothetical protein
MQRAWAPDIADAAITVLTRPGYHPGQAAPPGVFTP